MKIHPSDPHAEIERCIREQRACVDYISNGGEDPQAAMWGIADWLCEEAIIRLEHGILK